MQHIQDNTEQHTDNTEQDNTEQDNTEQHTETETNNHAENSTHLNAQNKAQRICTHIVLICIMNKYI